MTKHNFRLQPVLNYKESIVELRQMELGAAQASLQAGKTLLENLQVEAHQVAQLITVQQAPGELDLVVLGMCRTYLEDLLSRIARQELVVIELAAVVERCLEALVSAKQEQETLEKLKARAKELFDQTMLQIESRIIDESATSGFNRRSEERLNDRK